MELRPDSLDQQIDNRLDLFLGQLVEYDDFVDAVQELGTELLLQRVHHLLAHLVVVELIVFLGKPDRLLAQLCGPQVRSHDDDGVLEVHGSALGIGEASVFEDLEEDVENIGVRLLDLVEQDDREWLAAYRFGELTALVVADVTGGRADETAYCVLLHVLRHVDLDEGVLVTEQELGQRL